MLGRLPLVPPQPHICQTALLAFDVLYILWLLGNLETMWSMSADYFLFTRFVEYDILNYIVAWLFWKVLICIEK